MISLEEKIRPHRKKLAGLAHHWIRNYILRIRL